MIGSIVIVGLVRLARRGEWLLSFYVLGTIAAVSSTPWPLQHVRYLSPAVPVLLVALFTALCDAYGAARKLGSGLGWLLRIGVIGLIVLIAVEESATYYQAHTKYLIASDVRDRTGRPVVYKQLFYYNENVAMDECITWLQKHAKQSDVIAASMAHWVYLRTGFKTVMPPLEANAAIANHLLDSVSVRYIIQETPSFYASRYVSNAIQADPAGWRLVHVARADDVRVYQRVVTP